jgi:hypothetical protein
VASAPERFIRTSSALVAGTVLQHKMVEQPIITSFKHAIKGNSHGKKNTRLNVFAAR